MKKEFENYLIAIGVNELFLDRAKEVVSFFQVNMMDTIDNIFITDYIDEQGLRHYDSLWLFTDKFMMEAKQFLTQDNFDIASFSNKIKYLVIKKVDYDFIKANTKSRMTIRFTTNGEITGELKSSQNNCDYLREIYKKLLKINLLV